MEGFYRELAQAATVRVNSPAHTPWRWTLGEISMSLTPATSAFRNFGCQQVQAKTRLGPAKPQGVMNRMEQLQLGSAGDARGGFDPPDTVFVVPPSVEFHASQQALLRDGETANRFEPSLGIP